MFHITSISTNPAVYISEGSRLQSYVFPDCIGPSRFKGFQPLEGLSVTHQSHQILLYRKVKPS